MYLFRVSRRIFDSDDLEQFSKARLTERDCNADDGGGYAMMMMMMRRRRRRRIMTMMMMMMMMTMMMMMMMMILVINNKAIRMMRILIVIITRIRITMIITIIPMQNVIRLDIIRNSNHNNDKEEIGFCHFWCRSSRSAENSLGTASCGAWQRGALRLWEFRLNEGATEREREREREKRYMYIYIHVHIQKQIHIYAVKLLTGPRFAILIVTNWATLIVTNWATSFSHYKNRGFRWFLWCSVISLCFFFVFSYFSVI